MPVTEPRFPPALSISFLSPRLSLVRCTVLFCVFATVVVLTGCNRILDPVREQYRPVSLHDGYRHALDTAGLLEHRLGAAWMHEAESALASPVPVSLPHQEVIFSDPTRPEAHTFRFDLTTGQRLEVAVQADFQVFIDVFEDRSGEGLGLRRVDSADSTLTLAHDAMRSAPYVLRVQPELLVEGAYTLTLVQTASIIFPVAGRGYYDVGSFFGDPRDGGRREHHGLDIFAPRHTPVVAVVDGVIRSTRVGGLGGKTIWLRDTTTGANVYYAHLEEQLVEPGMHVATGDTIGTVGNSGNAISTPPHLHFGIYRNGPNDPWPFVFRPNDPVAPPRVDMAVLGVWLRDARMADTAVRVLGAARDAYRVRRADGTTAYVSARSLEPLDRPLDSITLTSAAAVRSRPHRAAPTIALLEAGSTGHIVARDGRDSNVTDDNFAAIALPDGRLGWISTLQ
jgi:murein DD-endopeptidase MepM/ murein hydrolase activator NlpD